MILYIKQKLEPKERRKIARENFIENTFPQKGDSPQLKVQKVIMLLCAVTFVLSASYIGYKLVLESFITEQTYSTYRDIYSTEVSGSDEKNEDGTLIDFDALLELNSDIVGWITIPGTSIDYPVLQSSEDNPTYYLKHNVNKEYASSGSIFADVSSTISADGNSQGVVLYGHHMRNGTMFAKILNYTKLSFYKENAIFRFDTIYERSDYVVFAVIKANTLTSQGTPFKYAISSWDSDEEFLEYIDEVEERSLINSTVEVNADDEILILSTCSYEYDGFRTVVFARKLRDGEDTVDVSGATVASNPLMPDIYYNR